MAEDSEIPLSMEEETKPSLFFNAYSDRPEWEFNYKGLSMIIERSRREHKAFGPRSKEFYIPRGTIVGVGGFVPIEDSRGVHIPGTERQVILQGIEAFSEFFSSIGRSDPSHPDQPMPEPKFITGVTNERMAKFLNRLGFTTVEPMGGIHFRGLEIGKDQFEVIGETKEVKERFEELKQRLVGRV